MRATICSNFTLHVNVGFYRRLSSVKPIRRLRSPWAARTHIQATIILAMGPDQMLVMGPDPVLAMGPDPMLAMGSDLMLAMGPDPVLAMGPDLMLAMEPDPMLAMGTLHRRKIRTKKNVNPTTHLEVDTTSTVRAT